MGGAGAGGAATGGGPPQQVDAVFAALADPTRRAVLDHLAADGPLTATELAPHHGVTRQAVAKHLAALEAAGAVRRERSGREVRYGVVDGALDGASGWMADVGRRWDRRLAALAREVGGGGPEAGPG